MVKKCSFCTEENYDNAVYCRYCGESLSDLAFQKPGYNHSMMKPKTSGMAIASLVCSLVGLLCCYFVLPVLGIIFGFVAMNEINKSDGMIQGNGMAIAGLIIGFLGIIVDVIVILIGLPFMLMGLF